MDEYLKSWESPKLNQEETDSLNKPIIFEEIEDVIKWRMPLILALGRQREADFCEFKAGLRYKVGRLLEYNEKEVFAVAKPEDILLPRLNILSPYIFAKANDFFAYPNNYNYYVQYYKNTFQHGGISMEEVLVPFIHLMRK